jgi:hypothetical protein
MVIKLAKEPDRIHNLINSLSKPSAWATLPNRYVVLHRLTKEHVILNEVKNLVLYRDAR